MRFQRRTVSDEIPTASMADIAFLLIIYFMVTTTFAATRGLDFSLPQDEDTPLVDKEESVLIEIQPGGTLIVDSKPMELGEILDYLKPKLERNPMKPVIIRPNEMAEFGHMVDVFDELRKPGRSKEKDLPAAERKLVEKFADYPVVKNISIPTQREVDMFWY